jgi:predicted glycoside hydrolase/deacetylase ChbG (UPF0249 family)
MACLIVNADDFGASPGINRGIVEAHHNGIVTSTSCMVGMPASAQAVALAGESPQLSIGLHAVFTTESGQHLIDLSNTRACRSLLRDQFSRFTDLFGHLPTHLDSHHHVHRAGQLRPLFLELAQTFELPLREHSPARHVGSFYGQWNGETHFEQLSSESLLRMLETEVVSGITELVCHPGYIDPDFISPYAIEREVELRTLCAPGIRAFLDGAGVWLIGFRDFAGPLAYATRIRNTPSPHREDRMPG